MLITDKNELKKYTTEHRIWQGIPSIEVTKGGRIFSTFYSGGIKEDVDNFVMLVKSDDGGKSFSEPIAVLFKKDYRCYDPCLWIDPLGRLWFTWALMRDHATYAVICDNPDADELVWGEERIIGHDVMMNKPTVLSTGEWLFPIGVWNDGVKVLDGDWLTKQKEKFSFVYRTTDQGKTFERIGGADVPDRSYDEHMVLERKDGVLAMYVRTVYGIGVSYSYDRGYTWTKGVDSKLVGPSSRFFMGRLPSGRVLFVNNDSSDIIRRDLTAFLSEDDGKTWKYKLLLDERTASSYPDMAIGPDGYLYITYDRERGALKTRLEDAYDSAREILYAKITEEDIIAGKVTSPEGKLKNIISKLGDYADAGENPYNEGKRFTPEAYAEYLAKNFAGEEADKIFEYYKDNCMNIHADNAKKLDELINAKNYTDAIKLIREADDTKQDKSMVELVRGVILENADKDLTASCIASILDMSLSFVESSFKAETATTVTEYYKAQKVFLAANK